MTAQFAKDQVSFFAPANFSSAAEPAVFAPANSSVFAAVRGWLTTAIQRRAVIAELSTLSERELTDIGLSRADIPRVFDRAFIAARAMPRA